MSSVFYPPGGTSSTWKDPVASQLDLPAAGNVLGDVRATTDDQRLWMWDGAMWVEVAGGGGGSADSFYIWQGDTGSMTATTPTDIASLLGDGLYISTNFDSGTDTGTISLIAGSINDAAISASAGIGYTKLNLTGGIVNADVSASAALALTKLTALTINRAVVTNGSGFLSAATTTATEIGYVNGVTSAIQTQLNSKQATITPANLTAPGTDGIVVTTGTNALLTAASIAQHVADGSHNGYLTSADWTTFNAKQAALTIGDISDVGTDGITIGGGTGAIIGSGVTLSQHVADSTHNGYLSSTDWSTFNGKQAAGNYITALTGDVTASGPGSVTATIGNNKVTDALIRQSAGVSLIGRSANTTGNVADITAASNNTVLKRASNALSFATIVDADIDAAAAIAFAKFASLASGNILVGSAGGVATSVAMSSEATIIASGAVTLSNAAVIGKVLTGYSAASGQIASTDTILQGMNKAVSSGATSTTLGIPLWNGTSGKLLQNVTTMIGSTNGDLQLGVAGTTTLQQIFTPAGSGGNNSCDLTIMTGNGATGSGNGRAGDLTLAAGGTVSSSIATSRAGSVSITAGSTTNAANTTTAGSITLTPGTSVGGQPGFVARAGRTSYTGIERETSSTTVTIANNVTVVIADYGSLQGSATYTLPAAANLTNGQHIKFGSGTNGITALTLSAGAGSSIVSPLTTLVAGTTAEYVYVTASTTWYRVS